jgi:hypothetical protein
MTSQDPDQDRKEQDSLAPVQLDRLTIEEEAAFMSRGKGKQLVTIALLASVLAVGGGFLMKTLDRVQAEHERSLAVAELRESHVDAFLSCVLPGIAPSAFDSRERLLGALERVVEQKQKRFAATLARCEVKLEGLERGLHAASVRSDLDPARGKLEREAKAITRSAAALREHLQDPARAYDYVQAVASIDRLARAAASYGAADQAYRAQLAAR